MRVHLGRRLLEVVSVHRQLHVVDADAVAQDPLEMALRLLVAKLHLVAQGDRTTDLPAENLHVTLVQEELAEVMLGQLEVLRLLLLQVGDLLGLLVAHSTDLLQVLGSHALCMSGLSALQLHLHLVHAFLPLLRALGAHGSGASLRLHDLLQQSLAELVLVDPSQLLLVRLGAQFYAILAQRKGVVVQLGQPVLRLRQRGLGHPLHVVLGQQAQRVDLVVRANLPRLGKDLDGLGKVVVVQTNLTGQLLCLHVKVQALHLEDRLLVLDALLVELGEELLLRGMTMPLGPHALDKLLGRGRQRQNHR
mmetsp:Transcript_27799/g.59848  ORF Transcript_27799/g.59848 Transcript_27799/m.59848 type:complete len:306 (-) Transcript_27799:1093-2010(-)